MVKKFPSLHDELDELIDDLIKDPLIGISLGSGLYKIKFSDKDKGKGKSGGFRIITYLVTETKNTHEVLLIFIYDKSEESTFIKDVLIKMVKNIMG